MPGDDYIFSLKFPESGILGTEKITSFRDLLESQINFYCNYHYRVILHTLLQVLLLLPGFVFDVSNAVVLMILPLIVMRIIPKKEKVSRHWLYLMILSFIWIFHFALGRAYFSTTGALNYSWYLIPQLLFVTELYNRRSDSKNGLFILLTLLSANGNENVLLTLCICVLGLFIYRAYILKQKPDYILLLSFFILSLGGIIMLLSPSLHWRISEQSMNFSGLSDRLLEYGKRQCYYILRYLPLMLILLLGYRRRRIGQLQIFLLFILFGSSLSMFLAPLYEPRSAVFGFMIFLMLMISLVDWTAGLRRYVLYPLLFISLLTTAIRVNIFQEVYQHFSSNTSELEKQKGRISTNVYLQPQCYNATSGLVICEEIADDSSYIDNQSIAAYYGVGSVSLLKQYSTSAMSASFISELDTDPQILNNYTSSERSGKTIDRIYISKSENGLKLLFSLNDEMEIPTRPAIIVRGHRAGSVSHSIISLLSYRYQLPFLDFLEYTGDHNSDSGPILIADDGQRYFYNFILKPDRYDYFLISLYDLDNHRSIGDIFRVDY